MAPPFLPFGALSFGLVVPGIGRRALTCEENRSKKRQYSRKVTESNRGDQRGKFKAWFPAIGGGKFLLFVGAHLSVRRKTDTAGLHGHAAIIKRLLACCARPTALADCYSVRTLPHAFFGNMPGRVVNGGPSALQPWSLAVCDITAGTRRRVLTLEDDLLLCCAYEVPRGPMISGTSSASLGPLDVRKIQMRGYRYRRACSDWRFILHSTSYPWKHIPAKNNHSAAPTNSHRIL